MAVAFVPLMLASPNVFGVLVTLGDGRMILVWPDLAVTLAAAVAGFSLSVAAPAISRKAGRIAGPGSLRAGVCSSLLPLGFMPLALLPLFLRRVVPQSVAANIAVVTPALLGTISILRAVSAAGGGRAEIRLGWRRLAVVFLSAWAFYFLVGWHVTAHIGPHSGDEGHYMIQAESLYEDGDFDIKNNLYATRVPRYMMRNYGALDAEPDMRALKLWYHVSKATKEPHWYSWHAVGLPVLLAPVHPFGNPGRHLVLGLIAAAAVAGVLKLCERFRTGAAAAVTVTGLFCASYFWGIYSVRCLPESLGAALTVWMFVGLTGNSGRNWRPVLYVSVLASLLFWVYPRFVPVALMGVGLCGLRCLATEKTWGGRFGKCAVLTLISMAGFAVFLFVQFSMFEGGQSNSVPGTLFSKPVGMWLILSNRLGLGYVMPGVFWILASAVWVTVTDRERRWPTAAALSVFAAVLLTSGATGHWHGGASVPGRFLVVAVPILLPAAAIAFQRQGWLSRSWFVFFMLWGTLPFLLFLANPDRVGARFSLPTQVLRYFFSHLRGTVNLFENTGPTPLHPLALAFAAVTFLLVFTDRHFLHLRTAAGAAVLAAMAVFNYERLDAGAPEAAGMFAGAATRLTAVQRWGGQFGARPDVIASYPLDGKLDEASGSGLHGTAAAVAFAEDRHGVEGGAVRLDGTASVDLPAMQIGRRGFTISVWARRAQPVNLRQMLVSQGTNATDRGLYMGFAADRPFTLSFFDNDLNISRKVSRRNKWQHWAATWDRNSGLRMVYCDGRLVGADFTKTPYSGAGPVRIGDTVWPDDASFIGDLDDLQFFDGALDPADIRALAGGGRQRG